MSKVNIRIQDAASYRLDEIYRYTCDRWGMLQADQLHHRVV
jgi:plasmid stabilization system protein ParE